MARSTTVHLFHIPSNIYALLSRNLIITHYCCSCFDTWYQLLTVSSPPSNIYTYVCVHNNFHQIWRGGLEKHHLNVFLLYGNLRLRFGGGLLWAKTGLEMLVGIVALYLFRRSHAQDLVMFGGKVVVVTRCSTMCHYALWEINQRDRRVECRWKSVFFNHSRLNMYFYVSWCPSSSFPKVFNFKCSTSVPTTFFHHDFNTRGTASVLQANVYIGM